MKTLKKYVVAFDLDSCTKCGQEQASPNGSLNWAVNEGIPATLKCWHCGTEHRIAKGWTNK